MHDNRNISRLPFTMSALASTISYLKGSFGSYCAGWLPFTMLHVEPVDLSGRNVLITGANVGVGYEAAMKLARFGAHVWLLCREASKAEAARAKIVQASGNPHISVAIVDLASFASVQTFLREWADAKRPVDILINNAGLWIGTFLKTVDGHELTYQTNFLSHMLLTLGLLPQFTERGRIVNVTSLGHYEEKEALLMPDINLDAWLEKLGIHEGDEIPAAWTLQLYARTKALQVVFTRQLHKRLSASPLSAQRNIIVNSCHPGFVNSTFWGRDEAWNGTIMKKIFVWMVSMLGVSCEQGACPVVFLATAPQLVTRGGGYWDRMTERTPTFVALNDSLGNSLWESWLSTKCFEGLANGLETQ